MKTFNTLLLTAVLVCFYTVNSWAENYTFATLNYPPYGYLCGTEAKGLDVAIIKEVFRRMGDTVSFKFLPWKRALAMAEHGKVDGLFMLVKTPDREKYMYYSDPVRKESMALFVCKDSCIEFDGDFNSLRGYTFGVVNDFSYGPELDEFIKKNKTKNVDLGESPLMNICKLVKRRFDFFIADDLSTFYIAHEAGLDTKIKRLEPFIGKNSVYISFLKCRKLEKLRDRFNAALRSMRTDGTLENIIQKYRQQKKEIFPDRSHQLTVIKK